MGPTENDGKGVSGAALRNHLDPGALAAQDFHHALQRVVDYISSYFVVLMGEKGCRMRRGLRYYTVSCRKGYATTQSVAGRASIRTDEGPSCVGLTYLS